MNLKAVHRIWREEGLSIKSRKRRRIQVERTHEEPPKTFGEVWAIDFASEWLENRRQARIVGIGGVATRENLRLKTKPSIRASHLVKELSWLFLVHGKPRKIRFDNGPEFRSKKLLTFLEEQGVEAGFIEPGSPWQNGHIESFFGKLRDELLNMEIFPTGKDLQAHLADFSDFYNHSRSHSALGSFTPSAFRRTLQSKMEAEKLTL